LFSLKKKMSTLTDPFTNYGMYIGFGALGGLIGPYALGRWNNSEPSLTDSYALQGAAAGAVLNYAAIMLYADLDKSSVIKGLLLGWAGAWIWNSMFKGVVNSTLSTSL
jgi:hypothetical protein